MFTEVNHQKPNESLFIKQNLPATTKETLNHLEDYLNNVDNFERAVKKQFSIRTSIQYIEQIGGKSYKDNIHRCLRAMYSNSMAKSCSWLGQRGNVKMKDTTIINIIKDVVATSYTSTTSSDYESVVSEWFRLASSRIKAKKPLV
ncbi:hypothetical protein RI129_003102 [Pyrocoelia pectoralis]|uniref:DUF4806 domain-containing protein n=1 Tax=Pyrocoelia pectoralis TaxID=417401 RepID=A0AAN7VHB4_9COLE